METEFQKGVQWVGQKQRKERAERDKIHRAHAQYVGEGKKLDEIYPILVERFGGEFQSLFGRELTHKVIDNIVSRRVGEVGDSLTIATVITAVQKLAQSCEEHVEEINDLLDGTDKEDFNDWVEVQQEETTGGKFAGMKTKRIPLAQYRQDLMDRREKTHLAFLEGIKAITNRDKFNILVQGGDVTVLADQDLERQLAEFNRQKSKSVSEV